MKKKNTLKVKPLRRYNTPVYPSYLDKNPIEHPDTLPYPFTYKALQVLAGAGILVGASCTPTKQVSDNSSDIQPDMVLQDSLVNPFTFEKLAVPFMTSSFGTGMPARLGADEARTVINQVFEEEGINLEKNYFYKKDSITVILDGFNPDSNIGYIWVDWDKMGDGMIMQWYPVSYEEILNQCFLNYDIKQMPDLEYHAESIATRKENIEKFGQRFKTSQNMTSDEEKMLAYKEIYLDYQIDWYNKSDNQEDIYAFQHITPQSSFDEKRETYIRNLLASRVKNIIRSFEQKTTLMQILDVILQLDNEQEKAKQYDNLIEFIELHQGNKSKKIENSQTQQILNLQNKKKIAEEIQALANDHLDKKLSLQETKYLENIHHSEKDFIAPISQMDRRFSHDNRILEFENGETINPKDKTLKALETQVRQYIQWAKQQSGH